MLRGFRGRWLVDILIEITQVGGLLRHIDVCGTQGFDFGDQGCISGRGFQDLRIGKEFARRLCENSNQDDQDDEEHCASFHYIGVNKNSTTRILFVRQDPVQILQAFGDCLFGGFHSAPRRRHGTGYGLCLRIPSREFHETGGNLRRLRGQLLDLANLRKTHLRTQNALIVQRTRLLRLLIQRLEDLGDSRTNITPNLLLGFVILIQFGEARHCFPMRM